MYVSVSVNNLATALIAARSIQSANVWMDDKVFEAI